MPILAVARVDEMGGEEVVARWVGGERELPPPQVGFGVGGEGVAEGDDSAERCRPKDFHMNRRGCFSCSSAAAVVGRATGKDPLANSPCPTKLSPAPPERSTPRLYCDPALCPDPSPSSPRGLALPREPLLLLRCRSLSVAGAEGE